jgi:hypothetical protein
VRGGSGHQADDRQFPVGLLLILSETGRGGDDLLPGFCARLSVELLSGLITSLVPHDREHFRSAPGRDHRTMPDVPPDHCSG